MRALVFCMMCCLSLLHVPTAIATQEVRVGGYHFPPYVERPESSQPQGLVPDLLQALNATQQRYRFVLVPTSAPRRYRDLENGRFDLMFFESSTWGWQGRSYLALDLNVDDAEVFVAAAQPGRGQEYFQDLSDKRMALYHGYHYRFAGFNADPDHLVRNYNAMLTYSHDSNLLMLLAQRADVAVVTRSYLQMFLDRHPALVPELLVSAQADQLYHHQILLRRGGPLKPAQIGELLRQLKGSGEFSRLLDRYHLTLIDKESGR